MQPHRPYCGTSPTRRFLARPSSPVLLATWARSATPKADSRLAATPIVADQHRCYCFGTAFGQGNVGLQRALVVGMAHHAQFEGTLRKLPDTGMANQSSRGIGLSVRFAKIALRILCITLARTWRTDRGGMQGVFLQSIAGY